MNTHRAVIECSYPPGMKLIASGDREHCRKALVDYLAKRPLGQYERPALLQLAGAWLPTNDEQLDRLVRTDPGVAALARMFHHRGVAAERRRVHGYG